MDGLSIRKVIEQVHAGTLRIPAFQRGFVWDAEDVSYFMDSIYKGYPFGVAILWRTKEKLKTERRLGPFSLADHDPEYPIDYVLDGQQRLTSIFGVFQTDISPSDDAEWIHVYYDFLASGDLQETQFVTLNGADADPARYFPIGTFFNVTEYRKATSGLTPAKAELIDSVQAVFKEADIPIQYLETDNRAKVAIVFERVNSRGVDLDIYQLLSAWTWSEEFDLQEQFSDLTEELRPFGFESVGEDTNLLLRCCAGVVANDAAPRALIALNGSDVRDRFPEIVSGIRGAIDFLRRDVKVTTLENLPYTTLLVPLTAFFAGPDGRAVKLSDRQRGILVRWFWRACFSRRYSAGVLRNLNRDIEEAVKLRRGESFTLADFAATVDASYFTEQNFTLGTVHTKTFVMLLAQASPLSFVNGSPITLDEVLQSYNRNEFHHLYPRAFLKKQGRSTREINRLANFAFMSRVDNTTLGGAAPSVYRAKMDNSALPKILERAHCPASLFDDDYDVFVQDRAAALANVAQHLMGS